MFTGLVEGVRPVSALSQQDGAVRLTIELGDLADGVKIGDSISVSGVCLTVTDLNGSVAGFDVIRETLEKTNLIELTVDGAVNVERALRVGDRLGGHVVSGHVDGIGTVVENKPDDGQVLFTVSCSDKLIQHMVTKGSIAIDGVSLTIIEVQDDRFSVALIPHTLENTTLGLRPVDTRVNLETDVFAKFAERLLDPYRKS